MEKRCYGRTDLYVSPLCFGPMRFSEKSPGDDPKSNAGERALARAIERGVDFLHSSYEYGTRWAMGNVLKAHPQRGELKHIIKVPVPDFKDANFSADKFRERIEEALRELHTDTIHIVQWLLRADPNDDAHRIPRIAECLDATLEIFQTLRDEGKVGYLAPFPYTPGFARAILETGQMEGLVAYYNLLEMEMYPFFDRLDKQGYGFICIRPFLEGLLTDERIDPTQTPQGDRARDPNWASRYALLDKAKAVLDNEPASWTDFALQFCLADPRVTSLVVGLNTEKQVDQACDAVEQNPVAADVPRRVYEALRNDLPKAS
ncbi:MAG: aldo/keto reductase [Abitibacteriaceae bacterium]|nr:aldo/keto reductase [Abditibacteriaceae bacterium]